MQVQVVTVGNATLDAFLSLHDTHAMCRIDAATGDLCIKSGEKILVDNCEFLLGGNASNVAVGLSRMGVTSALCAEIGDDELSEKLIKTLYNEKVDFHLLKRTKGAATSFAVILNVSGERTVFVQHVDRKHEFDLSSVTTDWIYLTSLGHEWKKPYADTLDYVASTHTRLAFSPGGFQLKEKDESVMRAVSMSEIVFVNKEEAQKLASNSEASVEELLKILQGLGSEIVVITDGKNGSHAIDKNGIIVSYGIVEAEVVEKTGAGDAYATGFLSAYMLEKSVEEAMHWGATNSASVIGKVGAQGGLLTQEQLILRLG